VKESIKDILHKVYYSVSANLLNLLSSILLSLIIPKVLGIEQYGYWQLYIFYVGYVAFFHFGLSDGLYLRYGGMYYGELDKSLIHSQFLLLTITEVIVCVGICSYAIFAIKDSNKSIILIATGLNAIIILPRSIFYLIMQATGRIKQYAKNTILERIIFTILVFVFLYRGYNNYKILLFADIFAKTIAFISVVWVCKDIVFAKGVSWSNSIQEGWRNISVGFQLLIANIAGMLIIGIVRFGIERNWDIITFGKVSFSLSISNLILTFIAAIGVVIFPIIKRTDSGKLPIVYNTIGTLLSGCMLVFLIAYYPIQRLLIIWLPHFYEAIQFFSILFPIIVFEARSSLLINTYLKALREEKAMLVINGFSVLLSLTITIIVTLIFRDLTLAVISIVALQMVKCIIPDLYLQRKMKMKLSFEVLWDILGTVVFIFGNWFIRGFHGWLIYIGFIVVVGILRRKEFANHLKLVKEFIA